MAIDTQALSETTPAHENSSTPQIKEKPGLLRDLREKILQAMKRGGGREALRTIATHTLPLPEQLPTVNSEETIAVLKDKLDVTNPIKSKEAIDAIAEIALKADYPNAQIAAIKALGDYAGTQIKEAWEITKHHLETRQQQREAGNQITDIALKAGNQEVSTEAVNELARGLDTTDLGKGQRHASVINNIARVARASQNEGVKNNAIAKLTQYAEKTPTHWGYVGSTSFENVQTQVPKVVKNISATPNTITSNAQL